MLVQLPSFSTALPSQVPAQSSTAVELHALSQPLNIADPPQTPEQSSAVEQSLSAGSESEATGPASVQLQIPNSIKPRTNDGRYFTVVILMCKYFGIQVRINLFYNKVSYKDVSHFPIKLTFKLP